MPDYALNLDAPDPLAPLADYSEPSARDLALMVAFTHFLFTDATFAFGVLDRCLNHAGPRAVRAGVGGMVGEP